jgi:hypothetical protein
MGKKCRVFKVFKLKNLLYMVELTEGFPAAAIVSTLPTKLSWSKNYMPPCWRRGRI